MIQYVYFLLSPLEKPCLCTQAGVCLFVSALFVVMKNWNLLKCPAVGEWLNKLSDILTTDSYAVVAKNRHINTYGRGKLTLVK